ncbi:hypothetical protein LCGC14_2786360 [marine sediment metagenome]|uniref:Uncharacterized protein n=1 Tax=marine sediment metagenome TaxID=412755 RepID=A0A0F9BIC2_9ZZZZ
MISLTQKIWMGEVARDFFRDYGRPLVFEQILYIWYEEDQARRREWFAWSMGAF